MCGRYSLAASPEDLAGEFGLDEPPAFAPRFNVAPAQPVPVVREEEGRRRLALVRWGLDLVVPATRPAAPSSARQGRLFDDPAERAPAGPAARLVINARAETVARSRAFREAFASRRCLVPATGFFEWRKEGGRKRAFHIHRRGGGLLAFAGLLPRQGEGEACVILTTGANSLLRRVHDRMPVVLAGAERGAWLDPRGGEELQALLRPAPEDELVADEVGAAVGRASHEGPDCIVPIGVL